MKRIWQILLILLIIFLLIGTFYILFQWDRIFPNVPFNFSEECKNIGGNWIESFNECEGISGADCIRFNGEFNECASACRNDPSAEICTMNCVAVCKFPSA